MHSEALLKLKKQADKAYLRRETYRAINNPISVKHEQWGRKQLARLKYERRHGR